MKDDRDLLSAAREIAEIVETFGLKPLIIGAIALAAHRYPRFTKDLDLAVNASLIQLQELNEALESNGYQTTLHKPDHHDPLGGVLDISGPFGLVQIVNFGERFPAVINDALDLPPLHLSENSPLAVIPLPHLVALKLYAGGLKSKSDILELLRRNPDANLLEIRSLCESYCLGGLDEILAELGTS